MLNLAPALWSDKAANLAQIGQTAWLYTSISAGEIMTSLR